MRIVLSTAMLLAVSVSAQAQTQEPINMAVHVTELRSSRSCTDTRGWWSTVSRRSRTA